MTQAMNPYLPAWEYIPDGEPYVFGDRLYIYGSHDRFDGSAYCMNDYVCWSAPVSDLGSWRYEGVIYRKDQDPRNAEGEHCLYAPDVQQGPDRRYYLYYALDNVGVMSVAVSDTPSGPFAYYGDVHYPDGHVLGEAAGDIFNFDPGVLVDTDNRVYLYTGFAPRMEWHSGNSEAAASQEGAYFIELERDMLTIKEGPRLILRRAGDAEGTGFEEHEFFEASSLRKVRGQYYMIYSSVQGHELCYAVSERPDGPFRFGGTLVSNGDVYLCGRTVEEALNYTGNNHGSIVEIDGEWYVFYHRQTNLHQFSRQACAEHFCFQDDGSIRQVEMTSCGLNGGPLMGKGTYEARIACNLRSGQGACPYAHNRKMPAESHPYFTQDTPDSDTEGIQYIANMQNGALAGFKYFRLENLSDIMVSTRGSGTGKILVFTQLDGQPIADISLSPSTDWQAYKTHVAQVTGVLPLYFEYRGEGAVDFLAFALT